jgi:RNA polymerase sigma-70 factor, ECF subfamily
MTSAHPRDLLRRIASGERAAFSALYDATSGKLFAVCLNILRNRAEAEEALQETYVKVWRRAGSFDAERASAMSWLIAIARNAAIDIARKRKGVAVDLEAAAELEDDAPSPEAEAHASGEARRLHDCLGGLEGDQALFIRRAYIGGLSYSQVAEATGKPLGTVKSLIRRGLQKLRACLEAA